MKLAIICTMINGFGRRGFYNTQEIGIGRALCELGHEVTIYKCQNKKEADKVDTVDLAPGLKIHYIPVPGLGAHGILSTKVLSPKLDGVFCFSDQQIFLPHIERFCRKNGITFVPYVGTAHSLFTGPKAKLSDALFHSGTLKIFKRSKVICKTPGAYEELKALGVTDMRIAPVGLDTYVLKQDYASYDRHAIRKEYGFAPDDVVLLNIARLEPEKRPDVLIDILARVKGKKKFKLLLVGEGSMKEEIDRKITELSLTDDICLIRRVPYEEMWKLYHLADYFLNLNQGEIFGMAVMESVYYQTSVAASMAPGPSQILKSMPGHRLCMTDDEVIEWLLGEAPSKATLAESSKLLQEKFSWKHCARAIDEIVRESKSKKE